MRKYFNISNLYILLWVLYNMQSVLNITGSVFSRAIFLVLMLISLYYAFEFLREYQQSKYFKAVNLLLIMFIVYGTILLMYGQDVAGLKTVSNYVYLQYSLMAFLPIYPFYIFTRKGMLDKDVLFLWFFVFIVGTTLSYRDMQQFYYEEFDREETINNISYMFLVLLPLLCLFDDKKAVQYALWLYCLFFILMGLKRGAILLGVICSVLFFYYSLSDTKGIKKIIIILAIVAIVLYLYKVFIGLAESSELFNRRLDDTTEGSFSGRDSLYGTFWNIFKNTSNPIRFLIGYGAHGTLELRGQYAHNDWLELAIDQGLLGIGLYINYWICSFKTWRSGQDVAPSVKFALGMTLLIAFGKSLFSMSFSNQPFYVTLAIGYCLAQYDISNAGIDEQDEEPIP